MSNEFSSYGRTQKKRLSSALVTFESSISQTDGSGPEPRQWGLSGEFDRKLQEWTVGFCRARSRYRFRALDL